MTSLNISLQRADDFFDFILLEETNAGDTRSSCGNTGGSILDGDAAERQDWKICGSRARFAQGF